MKQNNNDESKLTWRIWLIKNYLLIILIKMILLKILSERLLI